MMSLCQVRKQPNARKSSRPVSQLSILLLMFFAWSPVQAADGFKAEQLKVAFIYHFTQFINWPEDDQIQAKKNFNVCLTGKGYEARAWDDMNGKDVGGRSIQTAACTTCRECDLVFVTSSAAIKPFKQRGVLTISEQPGFAAAGGVIELYAVEGRLRFRINVDAAERAGLTISSRLLKLADIVHDNGVMP